MKKIKLIIVSVFSTIIILTSESFMFIKKQTNDTEQLVNLFRKYCTDLIEQRKIYHNKIAPILLPDVNDLSYVDNLTKLNADLALIKSQKTIDDENYDAELLIQKKWKKIFDDFYIKHPSKDTKILYDVFENFDLKTDSDVIKLRAIEKDFLNKFTAYFDFFVENLGKISVVNGQLSSNNQAVKDKYAIVGPEFLNSQHAYAKFVEEFKMKRVNAVKEMNAKLKIKELDNLVNQMK
jgi:hypothetical protein